MRIGLNCMKCQLDRQFRLARSLDDPEKQAQFIKDVCKIMSEADPSWPSPVLTPRFNKAFTKYSGLPEDRYVEIKKNSNDYLLAREDNIRAEINASPTPLLTALKLARAGNYIDFGALGNNVSSEKLDELLRFAADDPIDMDEFTRLSDELASAEKLVYLTDNAGELVLDKLLIEVLQREFPNLSITLGVRGYPILNDATIVDCKQVGLDKMLPIVENGSGIAGTFLADVSDEMRELLSGADLILAKGQGNFETMQGCGLNIFYVFLCKCQLFCDIFNVPQLTGMLLNEKRVKL